MALPLATVPIDPDPTPDDRVEVGRYRSVHEGLASSVVLLAMGEPCWLEPSEDDQPGERLLVEPGGAVIARAELCRFTRENAHPRPHPTPLPLPPLNRDWFTPLGWALLLLAGFQAQGRWPLWLEFGANDSLALFNQAQLWRPFTATFLHADLGHLTSNTIAGIFIARAIVVTFGTARAWTALLIATVLANTAVAWVHYPDSYRSIGASTAIFAGLGLLTGHAMRPSTGRAHPWRWRTLLIPLFAGATMLSLYGAGGGPVDVLAHLAGFIAGTIVAPCFSRRALPLGSGK